MEGLTRRRIDTLKASTINRNDLTISFRDIQGLVKTCTVYPNACTWKKIVKNGFGEDQKEIIVLQVDFSTAKRPNVPPASFRLLQVAAPRQQFVVSLAWFLFTRKLLILFCFLWFLSILWLRAHQCFFREPHSNLHANYPAAKRPTILPLSGKIAIINGYLPVYHEQNAKAITRYHTSCQVKHSGVLKSVHLPDLAKSRNNDMQIFRDRSSSTYLFHVHCFISFTLVHNRWIHAITCQWSSISIAEIFDCFSWKRSFQSVGKTIRNVFWGVNGAQRVFHRVVTRGKLKTSRA